MSKRLPVIVKYVLMILLFSVLGGGVLYLSGAPLATYVIAQGNKAIINGAPDSQNGNEPNLSKLEFKKNSTSDASEIQVPELNTSYGKITCDRIALSAPLYYGDSDESLLKGVGQYPNGYLPGCGKTIIVGGHDATFFAPLEQIQIGDTVTIKTDSGTYQYSVSSKIVAMADDDTAYDLNQDKEQLILYTCYPFGQLVGNRTSRFYVYCDPVTDIDEK